MDVMSVAIIVITCSAAGSYVACRLFQVNDDTPIRDRSRRLK